MFIAHGEKVRRYVPLVFGLIAVAVAIGLVGMFTQTSSRDRREEDLPTLRGKPIRVAEYEAARQDVRDLYFISSGRDLPQTPQFQVDLKRQAVIRYLQLRKAHEVGIRAPDDLFEQWIRTHPIFRNEQGQFDSDRYRRFMIMLNNRRISESRFLEIMRQEFVVGQLRDWIVAGAKATPQEVQLQYGPLHEKLAIDLVSFNMADNTTPVTVSEAEAEDHYKSRKETFRKPALVKVRYAFFAIDELKKTVKVSDADVDGFYEENRSRYPQVIALATNITAGATNVVSSINSNALASVKADIRDALAALAARRRAAELSQALAIKLVPDTGAAPPDFARLSAVAGAVVKETGYFAQGDTVPGVSGREFYNTAAWLARRHEPPVSDAIECPEGCYILEYLDGKPSRIPGFAEVKQQVLDRLKSERRYEATLEQGRAALAKVQALLAAGKSFSNACVELKLKAEPYGPFTAAEQDFAAPASSRIQQACLGMPTGAVSEFITTATGGQFFFLRDRQPPDAAAFQADRANITEQIVARNRRAFYESWVQSLVQDEQVNFGKPRAVPAPAPRETEEEPVELEPVPGKS